MEMMPVLPSRITSTASFWGQFFFEPFGVPNRNVSSTQAQEGLTSSPFIPDNTPLKPLAWIRALLLFSPP
jgi:hypothetical protein